MRVPIFCGERIWQELMVLLEGTKANDEPVSEKPAVGF